MRNESYTEAMTDRGDQNEDIHDDSASANGRESTGRWTREEHLLFVKGLELYGKGWKKIAETIKTRTVVQIRTHAQKYFLKLTKSKQGAHNFNDINTIEDDVPNESTSSRKRLKKVDDSFCSEETHTPDRSYSLLHSSTNVRVTTPSSSTKLFPLYLKNKSTPTSSYEVFSKEDYFGTNQCPTTLSSTERRNQLMLQIPDLSVLVEEAERCYRLEKPEMTPTDGRNSSGRRYSVSSDYGTSSSTIPISSRLSANSLNMIQLMNEEKRDTSSIPSIVHSNSSTNDTMNVCTEDMGGMIHIDNTTTNNSTGDTTVITTTSNTITTLTSLAKNYHTIPIESKDVTIIPEGYTDMKPYHNNDDEKHVLNTNKDQDIIENKGDFDVSNVNIIRTDSDSHIVSTPEVVSITPLSTPPTKSIMYSAASPIRTTALPASTTQLHNSSTPTTSSTNTSYLHNNMKSHGHKTFQETILTNPASYCTTNYSTYITGNSSSDDELFRPKSYKRHHSEEIRMKDIAHLMITIRNDNEINPTGSSTRNNTSTNNTTRIHKSRSTNDYFALQSGLGRTTSPSHLKVMNRV